ncbi:alpha/beta hydrolase [Viridibacillus sp. FSL E2-0187]|uniref:alpha/beta fold hydrolase n=1 Tax=Viridibacillus TaxID=496496 RepID=UPI0030F536CE
MRKTYGEYAINNFSIEYSIVGIGEPVIVFHGGHSNCQEDFGYKALLENGFSIITPSRAGYGKTSKEIGDTLSKACDYYAKLLQHLNIEKVHVLAISAGGPTGIIFAKKFPYLTRSLTLQSAVTKEWLKPKDRTYKAASFLFNSKTEKYTWGMISAMSNRFPHFTFKQMFSSFSTLKYKDAKDKINENDIALTAQMNNRQRSGHGFIIDLSQTKELTVKDLKTIKCPTLIMHSNFDSSVAIEHAKLAHENILHSKLCLLDTWGHLIWLGNLSNDTDDFVLKFLKDNIS